MPDKYGTCKILSNHFNTGVCKDSTYKVHIIEKLHGNGRAKRRAVDQEKTVLRKQRELYWMLELRTVFPYGLNDRIGDEYKKENAHYAVGKLFSTLKRKYPRLSRGNKRSADSKQSYQEFVDKFDTILVTDLKESLNFIRKSLA